MFTDAICYYFIFIIYFKIYSTFTYSIIAASIGHSLAISIIALIN